MVLTPTQQRDKQEYKAWLVFCECEERMLQTMVYPYLQRRWHIAQKTKRSQKAKDEAKPPPKPKKPSKRIPF